MTFSQFYSFINFINANSAIIHSKFFNFNVWLLTPVSKNFCPLHPFDIIPLSVRYPRVVSFWKILDRVVNLPPNHLLTYMKKPNQNVLTPQRSADLVRIYIYTALRISNEKTLYFLICYKLKALVLRLFGLQVCSFLSSETHWEIVLVFPLDKW